ncbi:cytochrome c [Deinococcus sp. KSM4-11]|uniref:c-type cytochrome n=1 Tax=Deinococcus sp. KSM4-11 TaxID=2568654 RepID=UPI0010A2D73B|nr:cytochrome c [Deinococcus sp. KSM4-11]THF86853.1 cytochrome c [Deinococcus sp. KSM4-11]
MDSHSPDRGFSVREIGGGLAFLVLGVVLGIGAYGAGGRLAGAGSGAAVSAAPATATPDGQALFASTCAGCHGAQAQGGIGPTLHAAARWTDTQFARAVLSGQTPTRELNAVMPRFGSVGLDGAPATDAQIAAIHTFLSTLK